MSRGKAYTRCARAKHINRKKAIIRKVMPWLMDLNEGHGWYKHDGQYSKGKIHCSCPICSMKAYYGGHTLSRQEQKQIAKLNGELKDFYVNGESNE